MWPWSKKSADKISSPAKYAHVGFAGSFRLCKVDKFCEMFHVVIYGKSFFLIKSDDGKIGRLLDGLMRPGVDYWFPHSGWTNAELRELGFTVTDDGIAPKEVQLARAVLSGDKTAAGALADWVIENWNKANEE